MSEYYPKCPPDVNCPKCNGQHSLAPARGSVAKCENCGQPATHSGEFCEGKESGGRVPICWKCAVTHKCSGVKPLPPNNQAHPTAAGGTGGAQKELQNMSNTSNVKKPAAVAGAAPCSAHDRRDSRIHPTHKMSAWKSTIISTANSDRFGELRKCLNCGAEQGSTVTGTHSHDELREPCSSVPNAQAEPRP